MQRSLAIAANAARHPFRQSVAHVRIHNRIREDDHDLKLFALSFTAFFICISTFIF